MGLKTLLIKDSPLSFQILPIIQIFLYQNALLRKVLTGLNLEEDSIWSLKGKVGTRTNLFRYLVELRFKKLTIILYSAPKSEVHSIQKRRIETNDKNIPNHLQSIVKMIYSMRNTKRKVKLYESHVLWGCKRINILWAVY